MLLLYNIKVNDYNRLHTTVKVLAKSLFLLYYTVYRELAGDLDPEDELHGASL